MIAYLMMAAGNLMFCLAGIGWLKALYPDGMDPAYGVFSGLLGGVLAAYLTLGPVLFLIPSQLKRRLRFLSIFLIYLTALALLAATTAFGLEFHRQLVKFQFPLVIMDPPRITLLFSGLYLPATVFLCYLMKRFSSSPSAGRTERPLSDTATPSRADPHPDAPATTPLTMPPH